MAECVWMLIDTCQKWVGVIVGLGWVRMASCRVRVVSRWVQVGTNGMLQVTLLSFFFISETNWHFCVCNWHSYLPTGVFIATRKLETNWRF